jgi:hypothetical protein
MTVARTPTPNSWQAVVFYNDAMVVNGPVWYALARVKPLRALTINGRRMRAVYVSPATNDGSAFMQHVVLIWSACGHSYGVGFHAVDGSDKALALDVELARGIRLVGPAATARASGRQLKQDTLLRPRQLGLRHIAKGTSAGLATATIAVIVATPCRVRDLSSTFQSTRNYAFP